MALETLADLDMIGGFAICRGKPDDMSWEEFDKAREQVPIHITDDHNMISFKIQNGPIKEVGVNGCQVDTIIETACIMISELNKKFPCRENSIAITKLQEALMWLEKRKKDRTFRGVEGISKV